MKFRTSNTQSVKFRMRKFVRRTRERIISELIHMLEGNGQNTHAAA